MHCVTQAIMVLSRLLLDGAIWMCTRRLRLAASAAAIQFMWHFLLLPWLSACGLLRVAFLALVVLDCLYVICAIAMPAAVTQQTAMALMFLGPCLWPMALMGLQATSSSPYVHFATEAAAQLTGAFMFVREWGELGIGEARVQRHHGLA